MNIVATVPFKRYLIDIVRYPDGELAYRGYRVKPHGVVEYVKCRTRAQEAAYPKSLAHAGAALVELHSQLKGSE